MDGGLKFGVSLPNRAVLMGMESSELLDIAQQVEQNEWFDSVWVGDNLLSRGRLEAVVLLGAIAARTERVRLGTVCLASFPLRDPLLLAVQWASLDLISSGRTDLAVCLGDGAAAGPEFARELAAMKVESRERVARLEEGIQVLRSIWDSNARTFSGKFSEFEELDVLPRPSQQQMPIMIGSNPPRNNSAIEERSLRRVARLANGWQTFGHSPSELHSRWNRIREYAAEYDRADDVWDCGVHFMVNIGETRDEARAEAERFLVEYYGESDVDRIGSLLDNGAIGTVDDVVERVHSYEGSGATRLIIRFVSWSQREQVQKFGQLAPLLNAQAAAG